MTNVTVFLMFYVPNEEQKVKNFGMEGEANYSCSCALEYCAQLALIFYQQDYRTVNFLRKFMRLKGLGFCIFFVMFVVLAWKRLHNIPSVYMHIMYPKKKYSI